MNRARAGSPFSMIADAFASRRSILVDMLVRDYDDGEMEEACVEARDVIRKYGMKPELAQRDLDFLAAAYAVLAMAADFMDRKQKGKR